MTSALTPPTDKSARFAFNEAAATPKRASPKKPSKAAAHVVSFRVNDAEKADLEHRAAGLSLSRFVREFLFNGTSKPARTRGRLPIKDHEALGRVLGALGRSGLADDLAELADMVDEGRILISQETDEALRQAVEDVSYMRAELLRALGLQARP